MLLSFHACILGYSLGFLLAAPVPATLRHSARQPCLAQPVLGNEAHADAVCARQSLLAPEAVRLHQLSGDGRQVVRELVDVLDGEDATLAAAGLKSRRSPYHVEVLIAGPAETQRGRAAEAAPQEAAGQSTCVTAGSQLALPLFVVLPGQAFFLFSFVSRLCFV